MFEKCSFQYGELFPQKLKLPMSAYRPAERSARQFPRFSPSTTRPTRVETGDCEVCANGGAATAPLERCAGKPAAEAWSASGYLLGAGPPVPGSAPRLEGGRDDHGPAPTGSDGKGIAPS